MWALAMGLLAVYSVQGARPVSMVSNPAAAPPQGADCQLGFNEKGSNADWSEDRRLLDQAVRAVNSLDPQVRACMQDNGNG